jgi:hypothetical protein
MQKQDMSSIGDIYGVIYESGPGAKDLKGYKPEIQKGGTEGVDGYNTIDNSSDCGCSEDEERRLDKSCWKRHHKEGTKMKGGVSVNNCVENEEEEDSTFKKKNSQKIVESEKNTSQTLNNFMSRKSVFDKLYNQVIKENWGMSEDAEDVDALGLGDATPDSDLEDDFGGEEKEEGKEGKVTFTLDRATAEKLLDVIGAAMGMEHDESEGEDEMGGEDEGLDFGSEDEYDTEEDEEVEGSSILSDKNFGKLQGRDNTVGKKPKASSAKAKSDINDEDTTNNFDTTVNYASGSNNKVGNLKQASDFFK